MKINKLDRAEHRLLSTAMIAALKDVGDKFGVDFTAAGGVIGMGDGVVKIGVKIRDTGNGVSGAKRDWNIWAERYGLTKEMFGETIVLQNTAYKIVGIKPGSPKYTVQIERLYDKKIFGTTVLSVTRALPKKIAA
jgi:hypothetical protein